MNSTRDGDVDVSAASSGAASHQVLSR